MGIIRKDFRYKLIKNFFTKEELKIGTHYFNLMHKRNDTNFDPMLHQSNNGDSAWNHDCLTDAFLIQKKKLMEKETGLKLFPTYAFTRYYTFNSELLKHKDRPSCEISVSAMWDSDGTKWPLYINGKGIEMEPGNAVIYLGREDEHWRETFEGDYQLQTFFHYVDKKGPYTEHAYDVIAKPQRGSMKYSPEMT
jgi:hypothetical protein|tara:strand:+ start:188 stop:766 length:579 start_codon:yes stop_codon:yes gene_type:complete